MLENAVNVRLSTVVIATTRTAVLLLRKSKDELEAAPWTSQILVGSFSMMGFLAIKVVAEIVAVVLSRGDHTAIEKWGVQEAPAPEPVQTMEPRIGTDLDTDTKLLQLLLARFQQDDLGRARLDGLVKELRQAGVGVALGAQHPEHVATKDALETTIGKSAEGERVQVL